LLGQRPQAHLGVSTAITRCHTQATVHPTSSTLRKNRMKSAGVHSARLETGGSSRELRAMFIRLTYSLSRSRLILFPPFDGCLTGDYVYSMVYSTGTRSSRNSSLVTSLEYALRVCLHFNLTPQSPVGQCTALSRSAGHPRPRRKPGSPKPTWRPSPHTLSEDTGIHRHEGPHVTPTVPVGATARRDAFVA
jgi:hypothetical protein